MAIRPQNPNRRRVTIIDIAKAAGVSKSTASRALTGNGYTSEKVRRRVLAAAERLHYIPDAHARQLRAQTSNIIGVVVSQLENSFYADLASGAAHEAKNRGYITLLFDDDSTSDILEAMLTMRVAGVVITPTDEKTTNLLLANNIPVVEADRVTATDRCDSVSVNNHDAVAIATRDLLDKGHRHIALLLDETDWTTGKDRLSGFKESYAREGIDISNAEVGYAGWSAQDARELVARLLEQKRVPTAIFAANNLLAEGAYRAIQDAGMSIPEDISLVCFDDAPWMSMVTPGITTIAQDAALLGTTAVRQLISRIGNPQAPFQATVLNAHIESRGSVKDISGQQNNA